MMSSYRFQISDFRFEMSDSRYQLTDRQRMKLLRGNNMVLLESLNPCLTERMMTPGRFVVNAQDNL
jgi:hypothetical protein